MLRLVLLAITPAAGGAGDGFGQCPRRLARLGGVGGGRMIGLGGALVVTGAAG